MRERKFQHPRLALPMKDIIARQAISDDCRIRPVSSGDAARIAEIYNYYILNTTVSFETEPLTENGMRCRIEDVACDYPYLVAEDSQGRLVGFCYAHPWKERAAYAGTWETTVYLHREACGIGIGRRMMVELMEACDRLGAHALVACITADNFRSIGFHGSLGFVEVSRFREVGRKFNHWLDVVDMQLLFP